LDHHLSPEQTTLTSETRRRFLFLCPPSDLQGHCQMRSSRRQGTACALRHSSSACDSFGPIRRTTNRPRFFENNLVLFI
jgi:hypothetical protein